MSKSTGYARRVDDFGRIVIPRTVRTDAGIRAGDTLEVRTRGNDIIFRKCRLSELYDIKEKLMLMAANCEEYFDETAAAQVRDLIALMRRAAEKIEEIGHE